MSRTSWLMSPCGGLISVGRRHVYLANASSVSFISLATCSPVSDVMYGWENVCESVLKPEETSRCSRLAASSILDPMRKKEALTFPAVRLPSTLFVGPDTGPSFRVSANLPLSLHWYASAIGWHGPQSSGQLPQDSPMGECGDSQTPLPHEVLTVPEYTGVGEGDPADGEGVKDGVFVVV